MTVVDDHPADRGADATLLVLTDCISLGSSAPCRAAASGISREVIAGAGPLCAVDRQRQAAGRAGAVVGRHQLPEA